jgi:hypothetical protein
MMTGRPNEGPKSKKLAKMAASRARSKKIPLALAMVEIYRENPGLRDAVRSEVLGERTDRIAIGSVGFELVTMSEASSLSADPAERLDEVAKIRQTERGIPYSQALCEVKRQCPELAHAARLRVLGREEV